MSSTPTFLSSFTGGDVQLVNASGTTLQTLFTAGVNGAVINVISVTSTDSSSRDVQLFINRTGSGTDELLATVAIAANSGNNSNVPSVNLLSAANSSPAFSRDQNGNPQIAMPAGAVLKVKNKTSAVTSGQAIAFVALGGSV